MSDPISEVLAEMASMWRPRVPTGASRQTTLQWCSEGGRCPSSLGCEYGDRRLRDEVLSFLDHMCNVFEKGRLASAPKLCL